MKIFYSVFFIALLFTYKVIAQAPVISYNTPQVYKINSAISPLLPNNTGGSVPAGIFGAVTTFAGIHHPGFANGTLATASFNQPRDATVDAAGNIFIVDDNNVVRKVTPDGTVTTFAGSSELGLADGNGTEASFKYMLGIVTDPAGNIYVSDSNNNEIRKITSAGVVTTLAGNGLAGAKDGVGSTASFNFPMGIAIDASGNLYVADMFNNKIRKVTPAGLVSTIASGFAQPEDVAVGANGNLYVADAGSNRIALVSPSGLVMTLAGNGSKGKEDGTGIRARFNFPCALTYVAGNIYVCDAFNQAIRKITPEGVVTTIAGAPDGDDDHYGDVDGIGTTAKFSFPYGIGTDGNSLFIADNQNSDIRKISLSGYTISPALPAGLSFDQTTGSITGTPTVLMGPITYTITAYNGYGSSVTTVVISVVNGIAQNITFPSPDVETYGEPEFDLLAFSTNNTLPLQYVSDNYAVANVSAKGKVHITGAGTCNITVSQPGDALYINAIPVTRALVVKPADLTISADDKARDYGLPNPVFTFSVKGLVYSETLASLDIQPVATTVADEASTPGVYDVTVSKALGANYTVHFANGKLTVNKAKQVITFNALAQKKIGDPNFLINASSNVGLPVTFKSGDVSIASIINNNEVVILKAGNVTITASQAGNEFYTAADAQQDLLIYPLSVNVPNTFTPNNDGVNDTWMITGVETDDTASIRVYNRNGLQVYQSNGHYTAWNGKIGSSELPAATYYYVITVKNGSQRLSGYVSIIR